MANPKIEMVLEHTAHLTAHEAMAVRSGIRAGSLDEAEVTLRALFGSEWLVYRGGSHVALHRAAGDDRRVAIYREV